MTGALTIPNGEWSVAILDALVRGAILPSCSVTITPKSRSGPAVKFEFRHVIVSGYSTSVSSEGDQISESLSLNFAELTYTVGGASVSSPRQFSR